MPSGLVLPLIDDIDELRQIVARSAFYLAGSDWSLTLPTSLTLPNSGSELAKHLPDLDAVLAPRYDKMKASFEVILPSVDGLGARVEEHDAIFLYDSRAYDDAEVGPIVRNARQQGKRIHHVDRTGVRTEGSNWIEARQAAVHRLGQAVRKSERRFAALTDACTSATATLLATGPSIGGFADIDFSNRTAIACNTVILDEDLMSKVQPKIVTFADPIFHFGCSSYGAAFRQALVDRSRSHDFWVVLPLKYHDLFITLLPELEKRTIALPHRHRSINLDLMDEFEVKTIDNIATFTMLSVASTIAENIEFLGFDGRNPQEQYFWTHSRRTQFHDLLPNIKRVHPGFFELDYVDYYDRHCTNLERYLTTGELRGKLYRPLAQSFIPALRRRSFGALAPEWPDLFTGERFSVISINPDRESEFGHFANHDRRLSETLAGRDATLVSLASKAWLGSEPQVAPTFTYNSWTVDRSQHRFYSRHFRTELEDALARIRQEVTDHNAVVMMYVGSPRHVIDLISAAATLDGTGIPIAVNLMMRHELLQEEVERGGGPLTTTLRLLAPLRRQRRVLVFADTDQQAVDLEPMLGERLPTWPMVGVTDLPDGQSSPPRPKDTITVYAAGTPQQAKGLDTTAALADLMAPEREAGTVRFVARASSSHEADLANGRLLAKLANDSVTLLTGVLDQNEYVDALQSADVVLLPYRNRPFRTRTSGLVIDALSVGRPVVTTRHSWGGDLVENVEAGTTFTDGDVYDCRLALLEVVKRYPEFAKRAAAAAPVVREQFQAKHLADLLEDLALSPSTEEPAGDLMPLVLEALRELSNPGLSWTPSGRPFEDDGSADAQVASLRKQLDAIRASPAYRLAHAAATNAQRTSPRLYQQMRRLVRGVVKRL